MKKPKLYQLKKGLFGLLLSILLIAVDQFTKTLAVEHLKNGRSIPLLEGVFELWYLENHGAAFGILQNQKTLFIVLTIIILVGIVYAYLCRIPDEKRYRFLDLIAVLLFSGAIGNFIDRVVQNYVVDFFYFIWIDFPIFNVADIYIVIGAALLAILGLFYYKDEDFDTILSGEKKDKNSN